MRCHGNVRNDGTMVQSTDSLMDKDVKSRGIHIQWIGLVRFYRAGSTVGATDSSSSVVDRIARATLPYLLNESSSERKMPWEPFHGNV